MTRPLLDHHRDLLAHESGIAEDRIRARGYWSATHTDELAALGFAPHQCVVPALVIPQRDVYGQNGAYIIRPDTPRVDSSGRPIKYELPAGSRMKLDAPASVHPLLGNPSIPLAITEGSRKVDAALSHGVNCVIGLFGVWNWRGTNNEGGKVALSDWDAIALNGRRVTIAFDSDLAKNKHVWNAAQRLASFLTSRGAHVHFLVMPPLRDGGKRGLDDHFAQGGTLAQLHEWTSTHLPPAPTVSETPEPFPVDTLPAPFDRFAAKGAKSRDIQPDFIATPLLGFAGAVIGDRVGLQIKTNRIERAVVWVGVVGGPGSGKSPGADFARAPLDAIQGELWEAYRRERDEADQDPKGASKLPRLTSVFTSDATLESIGPMLEQARGVAMYRDELTGWTTSMDAYRKGGDRQTWLSLWSGAPLKVDRKTSAPIYNPTPAISVAGGVQPDRLRDLRGGDADDGFLDRMLLSYPASRAVGWTDDEDDEGDVKAVAKAFKTLYGRWDREPVTTTFTPRALDLYKQFVNDNAAVIEESTGLAAGWAAKAPRHLARIALILHCMGNPENPEQKLDAGTLDRAIRLTEYFRAHFVRCLRAMGVVGATRPAGDSARVLGYLRRAPAANRWIARSALMDRTRLSADRLTAALTSLLQAGQAETRTAGGAGRPREEWRAVDTSLPTFSEVLNPEEEDAGHARPVSPPAAATSGRMTPPPMPPQGVASDIQDFRKSPCPVPLGQANSASLPRDRPAMDGGSHRVPTDGIDPWLLDDFGTTDTEAF